MELERLRATVKSTISECVSTISLCCRSETTCFTHLLNTICFYICCYILSTHALHIFFNTSPQRCRILTTLSQRLMYEHSKLHDDPSLRTSIFNREIEPTSFLSFPAELRVMVYSYAMDEDDTKTSHTKPLWKTYHHESTELKNVVVYMSIEQHISRSATKMCRAHYNVNRTLLAKPCLRWQRRLTKSHTKLCRKPTVRHLAC